MSSKESKYAMAHEISANDAIIEEPRTKEESSGKSIKKLTSKVTCPIPKNKINSALSSAHQTSISDWVQKLTSSTPSPETPLTPESLLTAGDQRSPTISESRVSPETLAGAVVAASLESVSRPAPTVKAKSRPPTKTKSGIQKQGEAKLGVIQKLAQRGWSNPERLWLFKGVATPIKNVFLSKKIAAAKRISVSKGVMRSNISVLSQNKGSYVKGLSQGKKAAGAQWVIAVKGKASAKNQTAGTVLGKMALKGQTCPPQGVETPKNRESPSGQLSPESTVWHERALDQSSDRDHSSDKERSSDVFGTMKDFTTVRDFRIAKDWGSVAKQWDPTSDPSSDKDQSSDRDVTSSRDHWIEKRNSDDLVSSSSGAGQEPETSGHSAQPDCSGVQWATVTRQALKESRQALIAARPPMKEACTSDDSQAGEESEDVPLNSNSQVVNTKPISKRGFWHQVASIAKANRSKTPKK
ncbi:uncharacterized protein LOC111253739 [Varroa destructor]|uniref:Uncharacterized protein n=1 Tax=Varroa destructor TaxID=109461 RepID=A0A7M7KN23_VARDE|nr:uncharacterized protein LOC111253739 [Varroa destructor]